MSDAELAFILEALKMVATEGWKILPQYVVNPQTGQWRHHTCSILRDKKSLYSLRFHDGKVTSHERRVSGEFSYKYLINQIHIGCLYYSFITFLLYRARHIPTNVHRVSTDCKKSIQQSAKASHEMYNS